MHGSIDGALQDIDASHCDGMALSAALDAKSGGCNCHVGSPTFILRFLVFVRRFVPFRALAR